MHEQPGKQITVDAAMRIAVADIGGTNARFALAEVADGKVVSLGEPVVLAAKDHAGLAEAWQAFGARLGEPLPRHAAFGLAGPVTGGPVRFVNSHWVVDPATLDGELGLEDFAGAQRFRRDGPCGRRAGPG